MKYQFSYLIRFQYLGFRFHGWQKQPDLKTVHFALDKTLNFVFEGIRFKSVGVGRTDAKVSSTDFVFQLFIDEEVAINRFIDLFNRNAPADIRVERIDSLEDPDFNIIQHPKIKEYHYYFSHGEKNHPYCAPFLTGYIEQLDIELMKRGAKLYEGHHNFKHYCTKPSSETILQRTIEHCEIIVNTEFSASFFPKTSYVLVIRGEGFLRNQIRLIMGTLVALGKGLHDLDFIKKSLLENSEIDFLKLIAPASGLHLHRVELKK